MSMANLDHELAQVVLTMNAEQRRLVAKKLARWSRQLRALDQSSNPRRALPRLGGRLLALN